ncbi:MAG TPA: Ig-like domain-containing protein, partial [Thermoanaerobaculia bacterium]|nr:Ig-like domain-containing protein [Thermoanaerobaculia bacterium]
ASFEGSARLGQEGSARVEARWDGRDAKGRAVPPGLYRYRFLARFAPDALGLAPAPGYAALTGKPGVVEARFSEEELWVDDTLTAEADQALRASRALAACQVQQNTPLEPGFGYNFYYGSTHSHSNWSDGGQPTTGCSSGNAYGSGTMDPAAVLSFARNNGGVDYWLINEHNHLIQDAIATNDPPVTEAKVRQRYAAGLAAAQAATVPDVFVALYGMEWGVTTNADQGHVTLIETPTLFGWESCTTCNGPNAECTPGSNCYFDVFTPKRFGYLTMYKRSVEHPSSAGALGILCHPGTGQFDNYAFNADADEALQGIAVRSGLAFNTATNCADVNVASFDYSSFWKDALNRGFHLGPTADHDSHCNTYGTGMPTRTVYLLPNSTTPVLTRAALLAAHKARHFFATEDANVQLVFATGDGSHIGGDLFSAAGGATLRAAVYDPDGESVSTLEIWRGQIGAGVPTAAYRSVSGQSSLSFTESLTSGSFYYYVHAVQADGHDVWSAPMWITYTPGACTDTTAPTVAIVSPTAGSTLPCAATVVAVSAADAAGIASAEVSLDGGAWTAATFDSASGQWRWSWTSPTAGAHTLSARATDSSCNANVGLSAPVAVTVSSCAPTGLSLAGWKVNQRNATFTYTFPAGTLIPDNGYLVLGRDATRAQFEAFWGALPAAAVYVNSAGALPQINGDEQFSLTNAGGTTVDGFTVRMPAGGGSALQRKDPFLAPGQAASWNTLATTAATPGSGAGAGCAKGVVVNEFADALGTGNFIYEFVELHYDKN